MGPIPGSKRQFQETWWTGAAGIGRVGYWAVAGNYLEHHYTQRRLFTSDQQPVYRQGVAPRYSP